MRFALGIAVLIITGVATAAGSAADQIFAKRTLRVGSILTPEDLTTPSGQMVGLEVRRAIYAGHPINQSDLGPPTLVRRNEIVTMTFRNRGIALRAEGRALGAGGSGEVVDVMNLESRRTIRAVVTGSRSVEVRR